MDKPHEQTARDNQAYREARRSTARYFVSEHAGATLTLAYLSLSILGLIHQAMVLLPFGINVVAFADASDFLLATVRDPLIVLAAGGSGFGIFAVLSWSFGLSIRRDPERYARQRQKYPRLSSPRTYVGLQFVAAALWAISMQLFYANHISDAVRRGEGRKVAVSLVTLGIPPRAFPADSALVIATTSKYLFLYFPAQYETRVVPVENVASLGRRRAPKHAPRLAPGWTDSIIAPMEKK